MSNICIDINCDLGEAEDPVGQARESRIMPLISSCNIACGFHAGSPTTMHKIVRMALENGVSIGAHPGFDDREGFGRRQIPISDVELEQLIAHQIEALQAVATACGAELKHVKLHGALYNQVSSSYEQALIAVQTVKTINSSLIWYALSGSESCRAAQDVGLRVAREAFIDRAYLPTGQLMSRSQPGSVLADHDTMAKRAIEMARTGQVIASDGSACNVPSETLCIHGDQTGADVTIRAVRSAFHAEGITVAPIT